MVISKNLILLLAALVMASCVHSSPTAQHPKADASLILSAPDGTAVKLEDLWRDHKAAVLVFWSTGCPCVRRYQDRIDALLVTYPPNQVRVVGISSNAGESFEEVKRVAEQRGVRIPIFRDESGKVAESVGARSTPTVVVIDALGNLRFRGWIDNERVPGDPDRQPYLDTAIRGVLAERNDFAERSPIFGCAITRSLFGSSSTTCCCCNHHQ